MEGKINIEELGLFGIVRTEEDQEVFENEVKHASKKKRSKAASIAARKKRAGKPVDVTKPWTRQFFEVITKPKIDSDSTPILGDRTTNYGRITPNITK